MAMEGAGMVGSCRESEDCYSEIKIRPVKIQQREAKLKK